MPLIRPPCPKCQTPLMLARRQPRSDGSEMRMFECDRCDENFMVKAGPDDPLDKAAGWIYGLQPPQ